MWTPSGVLAANILGPLTPTLNCFQILVITSFWPKVTTLKCFQCTRHVQDSDQPCPGPLSSAQEAAQDASKYQEAGSGYSCAVRVSGAGVVYHQGGIPTDSCSNNATITHVTSLVNKHSGKTGAQFVCCSNDGCNWSLDSAKNNLSLEEIDWGLLTTAAPFLIFGLIALALLLFCCILCCAGGGCTACGCLCCGATNKTKRKKTRTYKEIEEPNIDINNRYTTVEKQVSVKQLTPAASAKERSLTPVGSTEIPDQEAPGSDLAASQPDAGAARDVVEEPSVQIVVQEADVIPENNNEDLEAPETAKTKVPFGTPDPELPIFKDPVPINEKDINDRALYHFKAKPF